MTQQSEQTARKKIRQVLHNLMSETGSATQRYVGSDSNEILGFMPNEDWFRLRDKYCEEILSCRVDQSALNTVGQAERERADGGLWRETVRDIYDILHKQMFDRSNARRNCREVIEIIEKNHRAYFCDNATLKTKPSGDNGMTLPEGWQPIETAPKMGKIMLWFPCYKVPRFGWWNVPSNKWEEEGDSDKTYIAPTHWMPLPSPPRAAVQSAIEKIGE